jgi:hypothetical protein
MITLVLSPNKNEIKISIFIKSYNQPQLEKQWNLPGKNRKKIKKNENVKTSLRVTIPWVCSTVCERVVNTFYFLLFTFIDFYVFLCVFTCLY